MFRSDSNSEDLEGFAGAGLFESIPSQPNDTIVLNYASLSLISDVPFRQCLLERIGKVLHTYESQLTFSSLCLYVCVTCVVISWLLSLKIILTVQWI